MLRYERSRPLIAIISVLVLYIFYLHANYPAESECSALTLNLPIGAIAPTAAGMPPAQRGASRTGRKIAIATMNTEESSYSHLSLANKFGYAARHGYDLRFDVLGEVYWHKLTMVESLINEDKYDWIWWIDFDTLIMNTSVLLEDVIAEGLRNSTDPDGVDMLLTPDCFPLNAGSMIFRAHRRIFPFLKRVMQCKHRSDQPTEQDCMRDIIAANQHGEKKKALFIPQYKINAFPEEIGCYDEESTAWQPGTFVIHFAGAWAHVKNTTDPTGYLMQKYRRFIE